MNIFNPLTQFVKDKLSSQFIRNLGWLSIAEMIIRVSRLVTTVTLARFLSPYDYGLAAVVLSTNEFVQVFTRSGIGAKLIQVDEDRLEPLATAAYWLNWLICGSLFIIQGALIGVKELGIYYFAFNAGLGISLSFINAINLSLYPHLCAARLNWEQFKQRYFSSFNTITFIIVPIVLLQSSLAPFYVPIIFGEKWVVAVPVLVLICLSAISRPFADSASNLLLAIDKPDLDLVASGLFTVIFALGLFIGANWGVIGIAVSVLISHAVFQSLFTIWTTQYVFRPSKVSQP